MFSSLIDFTTVFAPALIKRNVQLRPLNYHGQPLVDDHFSRSMDSGKDAFLHLWFYFYWFCNTIDSTETITFFTTKS
jgi:hypothetical protein